MSAFVQLYLASLREWRRDSTALLWSMLFPLTYLADALRHSMTGANAAHAMTTNVLVLVVWWIGCALLALRFFRWEPAA